jgi:hypothetical protein
MLRLMTVDWYRVTIRGADHLSFSDAYLGDEKAPPGVMELKESHSIIQTLVLEFFEKYLRGSDMTPVLSRQRSFADLRIETRLRTSPH